MGHTFLMEAGRWRLQGTWLERNEMPITVRGRTLVAWGRENWFTMVTMLSFPSTDRQEISLQYRGRFDAGDRQYTFVLQHNVLGRVEGEGWVTPESIVQRYWVLGDRQRRSGFETLHRMNDNTYYLSSGIMAGHFLTSTMEGTLERLPESNYS
ncbi:hypothetical protein H6F74_03030 [Trichocoleus sp. FACHB-90]|uniref:Uncharacterized protein n=1 Tax=Funiculus sociatus GB2-A5 TaxID=2933946 RepID=A0ABV0JJT6_9CYAN|nr:hypothetical protein [Cyanobacteria bacterium FACHB-472]MBD1907085.1 hypothetical protein [Trichocoleus sp. FACHB-832]MBD1925262.1 hypothetical protein [Trichocoleus sp. FACHB-90]MBD2063512.1 hypothetical protein [Trichocoleus sp. FACHB-6]